MEERNLKWGGPSMPLPEGPKPATAFINFFLIIPLFSTEKGGGTKPPCQKSRGASPAPTPFLHLCFLPSSFPYFLYLSLTSIQNYYLSPLNG